MYELRHREWVLLDYACLASTEGLSVTTIGEILPFYGVSVVQAACCFTVFTEHNVPVGLDCAAVKSKPSSVSSACLRMKARVGVDRKIGRKARRIEEELQKSQERT